MTEFEDLRNFMHVCMRICIYLCTSVYMYEEEKMFTKCLDCEKFPEIYRFEDLHILWMILAQDSDMCDRFF